MFKIFGIGGNTEHLKIFFLNKFVILPVPVHCAPVHDYSCNSFYNSLFSIFSLPPTAPLAVPTSFPNQVMVAFN